MLKRILKHSEHVRDVWYTRNKHQTAHLYDHSDQTGWGGAADTAPPPLREVCVLDL